VDDATQHAGQLILIQIGQAVLPSLLGQAR
jgi:hypothetical protein